MKKKSKRLFVAILIACFAAGLASCDKATPFEKLQKENNDWIESADGVTLGNSLSLRDDVEWGMTREKVVNIVDSPLEDDFETYISTWVSSALPTDGGWKAGNKGVKADAFAKTEMKSYYTFGEDGLLFEYGYQHFSPTLEQYDFLKEYFSKKYGEPKKEEYIWNDQSYKPNGKEDLYAMFKKGQVKVMTVWDLGELDTILVVDWLNDPVKKQNNFGQVAFYEKTGELTFDEE